LRDAGRGKFRVFINGGDVLLGVVNRLLRHAYSRRHSLFAVRLLRPTAFRVFTGRR